MLSLFAIASIIVFLFFITVVYRRLIRPSGLRRSWQMFWLSLTICLVLLMLGSLFLSSHFSSGALTILFVSHGYYIMSFSIILLLLVFARDIVLHACRFFGWLLAKIFKRSGAVGALDSNASDDVDSAALEAEYQRMSRRHFLMSASSALIVGAALPATALAAHQARHGRVVKDIDIQFKALPSHLDGLRIVHLSDIHIGHTLAKADFASIVAETNALDGDLVVITGDLVDGTPHDIGSWLSPLRDIKSRYGVFYVTGNHEYFWDGSAWERVVAAHGVLVLHNSHRRLKVKDGFLLMAGVPDIISYRQTGIASDPRLALLDTEDKDFKIMLAHQPKSVMPSLEAGADLVLIGHTHGGQFWPGNLVVDSMYRFARGLYYVDDKAVFVSCGTGYWGPPLRFGFPPEICVLNLRSA